MKLTAEDKLDIIELTATFDNALDSEEVDKYMTVWAEDGELSGFWGSTKGRDNLKDQFSELLEGFARGRRHVLTNHEIKSDGDKVTMYCYLTVFNRADTTMAGTGTFNDTLVKVDGKWLFQKRELSADPNVMKLIESMNAED